MTSVFMKIFLKILGSGIMAIAILWGEAMGSVAWLPVSLAQDYRDTLNQKMVYLKQSPERWIEVNLTRQRLTAWEGEKPVRSIKISTGKKKTPTIPGLFNIQNKRRIDRMKGQDYDIDDVPYAQYYQGGYAIHGAYWHKNFGHPMSHGCINLAVDQAKWLFGWSKVGTPLVIHP